MNTNTGVTFSDGIGLMLNAFVPLDFFLLTDFFCGVFRNDDLKLPWRGNLIIHVGGTIIFACSPARKQTKKYFEIETIGLSD